MRRNDSIELVISRLDRFEQYNRDPPGLICFFVVRWARHQKGDRNETIGDATHIPAVMQVHAASNTHWHMTQAADGLGGDSVWVGLCTSVLKSKTVLVITVPLLVHCSDVT
mmetsp:Transcript_9317/g.25267  ORF Transcript_9317/g.25267 Transcript_9317/m.25267 type:complete len:111 (+) Transcript_9317:607-939(+)